MILELDIGNSRIKWRLLGSASANVSSGVLLNPAELKDKFTGQISIEKVRIACVRDNNTLAEVREWVRQKWRIEAEVAKVVRRCQGLKVSYVDLSRLGVDRWLAMLAAFRDSRTACMVVDCGTALTVDMIDSSGQHQGGYIVPGIRLMLETLTRNTSIKLTEPPQVYETTPGNSTEAAVYNGTLKMLVALIEKAFLEASAGLPAEEVCEVYLTGGDAGRISCFLADSGLPVKIVPDLVFDGLSVALG
ncbi:MAG: type III pantothenate kinase [Gammaproteobacteria bacterium]|nr:type III pantothenate kinase [Gammaproteobacteria bacterium]